MRSFLCSVQMLKEPCISSFPNSDKFPCIKAQNKHNYYGSNFKFSIANMVVFLFMYSILNVVYQMNKHTYWYVIAGL